MAIFARFAYAAGANVVGLLLLRFAIAGAMLAAWMLLTRRPWPRGRALAVAIAMGAVGYVGQAVCYFSALGHASAGLVALLLYVYPTLVCLLAALFLHERLAGSQVAWLVLNFAGIALTVGAGHGNATGVVLGLAAAVFYSVYIVVGARELGGTDALGITTVVCLSAAASLALGAALVPPALPSGLGGWIAAGAIAVVSTVLAISTFFAGLKRVGAATASIASTLEPVVTVVLAWAVLAETLSPAQWAGGALILASAAALARRPTPTPARRN